LRLLHADQRKIEEDKVYTVKLHHAQLETTAMHQGSVKFKELVEAGTNGKVVIDIFPNAQLGTDTEAAEYIQTGSIQAGIIPTAKLSGFHAPIQILDLPFLFPNRESLYKTMDDPEFLEKVLQTDGSCRIQGYQFLGKRIQTIYC
jgi:TRAP-type C4-dicarboxylate transport system substrate-binding protein